MTLEEIWHLSYKTIICYVFLILILKLMGKREVGKLSTFDVVVFFVISELFSLSLNEPKASILHSIIPIAIIVVLQIITAFISLKNRKFRKCMEGYPCFIVYKGEINIELMKKNRYNLDDFLLQLRIKDAITPEEVEFAILENNGELNVILKKDNDLVDPLPLIEDGKLNYKTLERINMDESRVVEIINQFGYLKIEEIFLLILKKQGPFIIPYKKAK